MMKNLLVSKGFKLNGYAEGNFYELTTIDQTTIAKILNDDFVGDEEMVVLQLKEDFSNKLLCVDGNVYDLNDSEFEKAINGL